MDKPRIIAVANRSEDRPPNLPAPTLTDLEKSVLRRMVDRGEMTPEEYKQETGEKPAKKTPPQKDLPQPTQTPEQQPAPTEKPTPANEPPAAPQEPKQEELEESAEPAASNEPPAAPTLPAEDPLTEADLDKDGEELAEEIDDKPRVVSQTTPREREVKEIDEITRENASRDITPLTRNVEQPLTYSTDEEKARAVEQAKRLYEERRRRANPWHTIKRALGLAKE